MFEPRMPRGSGGRGARLSSRDSIRLVNGLAPAAAWCLIQVLDAVSSQQAWPTAILAIFDELAHLLTAALVLALLPRSIIVRLWPWTLVGSVVIDIDHLPLYIFAPAFSVGGRPPTHSLITVLTLLAVAVGVHALRVPFAGLSVGVCLHFMRDVATGPGVPLLWPMVPTSVLVPYQFYLGAVGVAALLGTWAVFRQSRPVPESGSQGLRQA